MIQIASGEDADHFYDAIVVGAGAAGCVLANRLSENPSRQVLLVEAGPDCAAPGSEHADIRDPFCILASNNIEFRWPGLSAIVGPDVHYAQSFEAPFAQGFGVGGGSNINGMGIDRGLPSDFDEWAKLGLVSWDWAGVLPFFRKLERDINFGDSNALMHGRSGPIPVRRLSRSDWAPFAAEIAGVLEDRGFKYIADYTADFSDGFASVPTNNGPEGRVSASMAYLSQEVRRRHNLKIMSGALVDRVIVEGNQARGIALTGENGNVNIGGRTIILTCGAIQTPALLERSGIGRPNELTSLGIQVIRPATGVGKNLQNHPCVTLTTYLPRQMAQQPENRAFVQNWLRFSSGYNDCLSGDMHLMPFNLCDWHALGRRTGAVTVSVLKSFSKGKVTLASRDPYKSPRIHFNLLSDSRDEERLIDGVRFAFELLRSPRMSRLYHEFVLPNFKLVENLSRRNKWNDLRARAIVALLDIPLLGRLALRHAAINLTALMSDRNLLRELVLKLAQPQFHVCGTARMGLADDPDAVVDEFGNVHGIDNLKIADASIFPTIPSGYTHLIVMMAAEKVADAIVSEARTGAIRQRGSAN